MTTITLSRLKDLGSIDNPQASALERAIMHAIDSQPTGSSDGQITDADIAAFTAAFPGMGASLDAIEQAHLLSIFEAMSAGNPGNLGLISAARASALPYALVASDSPPSLATALALPEFTVQSGEGVWQVAERIKAELGARYPDVQAMPTAEVADKVLQANGLAMNADGSYPTVQAGDVLQVAPYADGAMDRVNALLDQLVQGLPEATRHTVLATLGTAAVIFLGALWLTPGPATVAALTYLAATLGEGFMVGAGAGLLTLLADAAMGSGTFKSAYEIKTNPEVQAVAAGMATALAAPKAIEYAGKGVTATSPYVKDALGKLSGILKPAAPVLETVGTMGADATVLPAIRANTSLTLGMNNFPVVTGQMRTVYVRVLDANGVDGWLPVVGTQKEIGERVAAMAMNPRAVVGDAYKINLSDGKVQLSSGPGQPVIVPVGVSADDAKAVAQSAYNQAQPYTHAGEAPAAAPPVMTRGNEWFHKKILDLISDGKVLELEQLLLNEPALRSVCGINDPNSIVALRTYSAELSAAQCQWAEYLRHRRTADVYVSLCKFLGIKF